jgi:hypothetical protein
MISDNNSLRETTQPVYVLARPGAIFLWAGALQASLLISCYIHVYIMSSSRTVRPQLASCRVRTCALSQIITFDHCTNLLAFPCPHLYFIFLAYTTFPYTYILRVDCCPLGMQPVYCAYVLCRCRVMTWGGAFPTSSSPARVGSTSPARGRPVADMLLCLLRLCMLSGNFLRAAQPVCFFDCLAWSDFPTGGGAPCLSSDVLLHPCLHHIIVINSEAAACMMSQHVCTADHNIPSLHSLALPCPSCISYSLAYTKPTLIYTYSCLHAFHISWHPVLIHTLLITCLHAVLLHT